MRGRKSIEEMLIPPADIPATKVELAELVSREDNALLHRKLADLGLKEGTIKKLKTLDTLTKSGGKFLAVGLEKTHRIYFVELINLYEMGESIRKRLEADDKKEGKERMSAEERFMLTRTYTEMVREHGRGYQNMLNGTEVMVRMIQGITDMTSPPKKVKPGWGGLELTQAKPPTQPDADAEG